MPRRTIARAVLAAGWLALFATSHVEHEWVIEADAQTARVSLPVEGERAFRVTVDVDGHAQAATAELYLALGGLGAETVFGLEEAFRDDGGLASMGPVRVYAPAPIWASAGFRRYGEDAPIAYFRHPAPCEAAPCTRAFEVVFRGAPSAFDADVVFGAGVLGRDTFEPPPGRVTLDVELVTP